mmetsp:Transcript_6227/g.19990  ORF Transcript_6227/g.19990 Transcript_6227/m.19990 type:complete len:93 (-) Transcript_6227:71-349(-)
MLTRCNILICCFQQRLIHFLVQDWKSAFLQDVELPSNQDTGLSQLSDVFETMPHWANGSYYVFKSDFIHRENNEIPGSSTDILSDLANCILV